MLKKITPLLIALVITSFSSCYDEDENLTPNPLFNNGTDQASSSNTMTATIDGVTVTFPNSDYDTIFFGHFKFVGQFSNFLDYRAIRFDFFDYEKELPPVGTYELDSMPGGVRAQYDGNVALTLDEENIYDAYDGSITISKATPELYEGTFSFKGKALKGNKTVNVTNGSFKASLRKQ